MILFSATLAVVSAGSMVSLKSAGWADPLALIFAVAAFVAVCAAEGSADSK